MRTLFAATFFALSLSASAFEFKNGNVTLPLSVEGTIHADVEELCSRDVSEIKSFTLTSHEVQLVRIDQGYKENQYNLKFDVTFKNSKKGFYEVLIVDQIEDRSGSLETYIIASRTNVCR